MAIIVFITAAILWFAIQNCLHDQGVAPLSRGQLRYMRRKARKLGVDSADLPYKPKQQTLPTMVQPGLSSALKRADWPEVIPPGWSPND